MKKHHRTKLNEIFNVTDLVSIYYYELNQSNSSTKHTLDCWQLHYQIKGEKKFKIGEEIHELKQGQLAIISPNTSRQIQNVYGFNDSAICGFDCKSPKIEFFNNKVISLTDDEIDLLLKIIYLGSNYFERVDTPRIYGMRTKDNTPESVLHALKIYLELFLLLVYNRLTNEKNSLNLLNINLENGHAKIVSDIKEYFAKHVDENLTIGQLSEYFKLSPTTLKTTFKKVTGQSLMNYFLALKIHKAKTLIKKGTLTLGEISDMLSYSSPAHFTTTFKKCTGKTPSEYLKNYTIEKTQANRNIPTD